ncbi:hypothetical protein C0995_015320, partial [Termitomyces sp. Mi166
YFTTTKQLSQRQAQWSETLSKYDFAIHYHPGCLGAKLNMLIRRSDVYLKKSFKVDHNTFNKCVVIFPEHFNSILLLNKEGLLNQICSASPNAYFKANNPQTTTNNLVAALHNSTLSSTTFTLSLNGKLLL